MPQNHTVPGLALVDLDSRVSQQNTAFLDVTHGRKLLIIVNGLTFKPSLKIKTNVFFSVAPCPLQVILLTVVLQFTALAD